MRLTSPRLSAVHSQADADLLWADVASTGTPLVERDGRLVTFLWRDDGRTDNVVVVGGPARWDPVEQDRMSRLPGTDVWFRSYPVEPGLVASYWLSPNDSLEPPEQVTDWDARERTFRADPLNPRVLHWPANPADPHTPAHTRSVLAIRDAAPVTGPTRRPVEHRVSSRRLGNTRRVWVHAPTDPSGARLVVLLDGWVWAEVLPVADLVDRGSRPIVIALVESLDEPTRDRELECHEPFVGFLTEELVPYLRREYGVAGRIGVVGQSLGGLTAVYAALTAPDVVEAAGAQSGSFWWPRDAADVPQEELTRQVRERDRVDVRIHLETGSLEGPEMVGPARRLRDALCARGYDVDYRERYGGHDWLRWRMDLPDLLERMCP